MSTCIKDNTPFHALLAALALSGVASAADPITLPAITVQSSPLQPELLELAQPATVLSGDALRRRQAATLGQTVEHVPGVQSATFGPGVGRPVIRGLDGPRVGVLSNGIDALDVSALSQDHAVSLEPLLLDRIEILKGPASLLYGSGGFGGVVNAVDGRIPERLSQRALRGAAELRGDTVADERTGVARLDGGVGALAWHLDGFRRETDDYEIPGRAERFPDADEQHRGGILENSAVETEGGGIGASLIGDRGLIGLSFGRYDTFYDVPGHGEHEEGEEQEAGVAIDLNSKRYSLRGELDTPLPGLESLRLAFGQHEYQHQELEGAEVGTRFDNDAKEGRLELVHASLAEWNGAFGVQHTDIDFSAVGAEAFVPPNDTRRNGVFLVETREWGPWGIELGTRYDRQRLAPQQAQTLRHRAFSLSGGVHYHVSEADTLKLFLARAERMPVAEELLADGPHVATRTFEIGDAGLAEETARNIDLSFIRHLGRLMGSVSVYHNRIRDFIFLSGTGAEQDGLPVRTYRQADARFTGAEFKTEVLLAERAGIETHLELLADTVRGELVQGGNLPRIAPGRIGLGLAFEAKHWHAAAEVSRVAQQDRTAAFETDTGGYTLLNIEAAYRIPTGTAEFELFLRGLNLTDEEARSHLSLLKDQAPLPGRSLALGLRARF